jgi:SAM-dependent methyltransferase
MNWRVVVAMAKTPPLLGRYKWAFRLLPPAGVVADIGGGVTALSYRLHEKAHFAAGIDVDAGSLETLRTTDAFVVPTRGSATALPLKSGSLDAALFLDVLEHVADPKKAIAELARVIRHGGHLVLSVPNRGLFQFLDPQNLRMRIDGTLSSQTEHRHYSLNDIAGFFGADFRILNLHSGGLFLYPLMFAFDNSVRKHLGRDWGWLFRRIADWDNQLSWGRWSYNLILLAERTVEENA